MKKLLSATLCVCLGLTQLVPITHVIAFNSADAPQKTDIVYPSGSDFTRLKTMIDVTFSPKPPNNYGYGCIASGTLCPNYKYTSVVEKAIKLIVTKTYTGNEQFYTTLFSSVDRYNYRDPSLPNSLNSLLQTIPTGTPESDWKNFNFGETSIAGGLLDASFGVNFSENVNSQSMLGAIDTKIQELKRQKCQRAEDYSNCYNNISNVYLPTPEELYDEMIYLNGDSVRIGALKDEFEYTVISGTGIQERLQKNSMVDTSEETKEVLAKSLQASIEEGVLSGTMTSSPQSTSSAYQPPIYFLRYKKNTYTLDEAKIFLNKKDIIPNKGITVFTTEPVPNAECICVGVHGSGSAICTGSVETRKYECTLDDPNKKKVPDISSGATKKDYLAILSGATIPEIPAIFAHAPADSMVLYIKNPANLIELLNQKSDTTNRLSGLDISATIKKLITTFFELQDFDKIEKNLKHDMLVVVNNLDATAPDIVLVLSEADREVLSPTANARVVGSKDGYIYVANSKESLEKVQNLAIGKSLKNASDFQYVWTKKSTLIKDAFVFVGDAFFEKMLTLENYIEHYRKYRDYRDLWSLQELVWAYGDAFGSLPTSFSEVSGLGLGTLTGSRLADFSLQDGLVAHKHIGTLKSIKTIPEARYDLSTLTRAELEDYKYNVQGYRDVWRAWLDPMGIVFNRYGDGMEVDFFMTPVPTFSDKFLESLRQTYEGTMKDVLSFTTNNSIRNGILSFVVGADMKKLNTRLQNDTSLREGLAEFNQDILPGKNILDYLGGEFALTLGSMDPDIFEGWNVEKIDAALLVQVANEQKGKELIDMIRSRMTERMGGGSMSMQDIAQNGANSALGFLAKPLIQDYNGKKIYYLENLPMSFVGNIGFAYTFIDDFLVIGLNRTTIKKYIDIAASGDREKKKLIDSSSFEKHTFFAGILDGKGASDQIQSLYQKTQSIPQSARNMLVGSNPIIYGVSTYYVIQDRTRRLGDTPSAFSHTIGGLSLTVSGSDMRVRLDPTTFSSLTGSLADEWKKIRESNTLPGDLTSQVGMDADRFLALTDADTLLELSLATQLDRALAGKDSLLRNTTFGMSLGDDEIGFRARIFRSIEGQVAGSDGGIPNYIWLIIGTVLGLLILGSAMTYTLRRKDTRIDASDSISAEETSLVTRSDISEDDSQIQKIKPVSSSDNI